MCKYCDNTAKTIPSYYNRDNPKTDLYITYSDLNITAYFSSTTLNVDFQDCFEINYCPMCGRKLREEN